MRYYNSTASLLPYTVTNLPTWQFGEYWRSNFDYRLFVISGSSYATAAVSLPDGSLQYFNAAGKPVLNYTNADESLQTISGGYIYQAENRQYTFDTTGKLTSIGLIGGVTRTLTYSDGTTGSNGGYVLLADGSASATTLPAGLLIRVTDSFGRTLSFGYDATNRVVKLIDSQNQIVL